jgi:formate-dependent nitrite reductase membrane component NrfD
MNASTLPVTLIILGALSSIALQAQKIAILENQKKHPSTKTNNTINYGLNFAQLLTFLGIVLLLVDKHRAIPQTVLKYETYLIALVGLILISIGATILTSKNVDNKVPSVQVVLIGLVVVIFSVKDILEHKE